MPSYGKKFFYALGFLALTSLVILITVGIIMAFKGPTWWLSAPLGIYFRSVHMWAVQAFMVILVCHVLVVFLTSGFKAPRRMVWVFGATIFCLALIQSEFGYALRGDFSSQYRNISAADFWNGAHLGWYINPESFAQVFAIHTAIIPIFILLLFVLHYLLVRTYGLAKPYRADIAYKMIPAKHAPLFIRGGVLVVLIMVMAFLFPSPFVEPTRITTVAQKDPALMAQTLMQEFDHTSDTATYLNSIDPYTFDTRQVYVVIPYEKYIGSREQNAWSLFQNESQEQQESDIAQAKQYFGGSETLATTSPSNPVVSMISALAPMAKSGLYESAINQENPNINYTYATRFLTDTGVIDAEAAMLHITTEEWGMTREETSSTSLLPLGSWWLAPIGVLNKTVLVNDPNGDRDGASILGVIMLIFILFPYIPYLNRLPEKLRLAPFIWK